MRTPKAGTIAILPGHHPNVSEQRNGITCRIFMRIEPIELIGGSLYKRQQRLVEGWTETSTGGEFAMSTQLHPCHQRFQSIRVPILSTLGIGGSYLHPPGF